MAVQDDPRVAQFHDERIHYDMRYKEGSSKNGFRGLVAALEEKASMSVTQIIFFAAAYGFKSGQRKSLKDSEGKKLQGKRLRDLRYHTFNEDDGLNFIDALAVYQTEGLDILKAEKFREKIEIFEEYANQGLFLLDQEMKSGDVEGVIQHLYKRIKIDEKESRNNALIG
tara:strand:+ start:799 stop:1305 length:507 start_codon:yes stop_codon:yes gene_type:complete